MLNFGELTHNGNENCCIENRGELHLPCVVLVDTSSSMYESSVQLKKGLEDLADALDEQARGRVEFCIITFDNTARVLVPFGPAYDYSVPNFECLGSTAMHNAVKLGLKELEARKKQYKENNTPYYRPWMFMLTDGCPNDSDDGSFRRLVDYQKNKHCTFFPVAIGNNVNMNLLKSLTITGKILKASKDNFVGAFVWLSNSLIQVSNSKQGEMVKLANPADYQIEVES